MRQCACFWGNLIDFVRGTMVEKAKNAHVVWNLVGVGIVGESKLPFYAYFDWYGNCDTKFDQGGICEKFTIPM